MRKISRELYLELSNLLDKIKIDFGGGCSVEKAYVLAWLIANFGLESTVDIGVYRGRSLFPQAFAHKKYTNGIVRGIDPWDRESARENDNPGLKKDIDAFLDNTDLNVIFTEVSRFNTEQGLDTHCVLIREKSEDAVRQFKAENVVFDLVHVDGNHDTELVMRDIELYCPLIKEKGFLILDDISWSSVKPAIDDVEKKYNLIYKKIDDLNDYAIFWNNKDRRQSKYLSRILEKINSSLEKEKVTESYKISGINYLPQLCRRISGFFVSSGNRILKSIKKHY